MPLLWNKELQPRYEVHQRLEEVYQLYAPFLRPYEDREMQEDTLRRLGKMVINSKQFKNLVFEQAISEVTHTVDEYLMLLSTYSPYLKLEQKSKEALFFGLRERIEHDFGGRLELSCISAFHIAQQC
jgi:hypothetical protein